MEAVILPWKCGAYGDASSSSRHESCSLEGSSILQSFYMECFQANKISDS